MSNIPGIPPRTVGCALCRRTLERAVAQGFTVTTHGRHVPAHPPVPVPMSQIHDPHLHCDHCDAPHPVWSYRTADIQAVAVDDLGEWVHDPGGAYATCADCAALIEARDPDGLLDRIIDGYAAINSGAVEIAVADGLALLHEAFWAGLRPGRLPLAGGAPSPAPPIRAGALPKVRDRLRDWWTGDWPAATAWLHPGGRQPLPPHLTDGTAHIAALAASLGRAALYWIDDEFSALARHAGGSLPALRIDRTQVPADDGLLVWADPIGEDEVLGDPVAAAHWTRVPGGWWICFATATGADLTEAALQTLRHAVGWLMPTSGGTFLPDDGVTDDDDRDWIATLVATWALIDQPLAATTHTAADPTVRRSYARAKRADPQVRVVRVRTGAARPSSATDQPPARTYSHRWWVNGFWRQQAHGPRWGMRRLVYIAGHLAGPADKPIQLRPTVHVLGHQTNPPTAH